MRTREFPVLGPEDAPLVDAVAVGLGREEARVLAYLILRAESDAEPASRLAVRVGTELGRKRTGEALSALEDAGLVSSTQIEQGTSGRPRKGWEVTGGRADLTATVRRHHAAGLLEGAQTVRNTVAGTDPTGGGAAPGEGGLDGTGGTCRLALNWMPNGFHAPLFFAAERGFYAGVDLTVRSARGSGRALQRVESGAADVGVVGSAVVCQALAGGRPVLPVALLYQRAMTVLYTTRSSFGTELTSVEQLRGRTVAMPPGSETALLARLFLSQAGVLDDVDVVESGGEERTELLDGDADVVTGMAADPPALAAEGHTVDSILVAEQFPVPGPALVVRTEALHDPPAALGDFLTGTMRGVVAATHDRKAAATAVTARSDDSVEAERRRLDVALDRFADSDAVREHGWGWQSTDDWQRLHTALQQTGALADTGT